MAISVVYNKYGSSPSPEQYCGLSTDTKPTAGVSTNALFLDLDTGDFYYFNGTAWAKVGG